jgi:plastocyanin
MRRDFWRLTCLAFLAPASACAQDLILTDSFDALNCAVPAAPRVVAAVGAASQSTLLGTVTQFPIEVRSCDYQGAVSIVLSGVPASWTAQLDGSPFVISPGQTVSSTLTVSVPSDGIGGLQSIGVEVQAGAGGNVAMTATLAVALEYVVTIPLGAGSTNHQFPSFLRLRVGTRLRVLNADSTPHLMHFDGTVGIPHQSTAAPINQGQEYAGTATIAGDDRMYCHAHGPSIAQPNLVVIN